jgi:hypothetical protein
MFEGKAAEDLRLFRRKQAGERLTAKIKYGDCVLNADNLRKPESFTAAFNIERCDLYVFPEPGLAAFLLEIALPFGQRVVTHVNGSSENGARPFSLAEALATQDALRRVYPPYVLDVGGSAAVDGTLFPLEVTIGTEPHQARYKAEAGSIESMVADLVDHGRTPLAPWWRALLKEVTFEGDERPCDGAPLWRQIVDERMPTIAFIGVPDIKKIQKEDMIRLCFADGPSQENYDEGFISGFEEKHCYDRFKHAGTRYLMSNYSFVCLCEVSGNEDFALNVIQEHTRRHYTHMFLLTQLQRAGLLMFSSWMSRSIHQSGEARTAGFEADMRTIQVEFAQFTHRFWFSNLSNQEQAREIFAKMQELTGARELYQEVKEEAALSQAVLTNEAAERQIDGTIALNAFLALSAIVAMPIAMVQGLSNLSTPMTIGVGHYYWALSLLFLFAAGVVLIVTTLQIEGAAGFANMRRVVFAPRGHRNRHSVVSWIIMLFLVLCLLATIGFGYLGYKKWDSDWTVFREARPSATPCPEGKTCP